MLGTHWIAEGTGCQGSRLVAGGCQSCLLELCRRLGMTAVSEAQVHEQDAAGTPSRIAGILLIAESHISVHIFPSDRVVHVDVFSCGAFDLPTARAVVQEHFAPTRWSEQCVDRGGSDEAGSVTKRR